MSRVSAHTYWLIAMVEPAEACWVLFFGTKNDVAAAAATEAKLLQA
jgi:hypothetical protein